MTWPLERAALMLAARDLGATPAALSHHEQVVLALIEELGLPVARTVWAGWMVVQSRLHRGAPVVPADQLDDWVGDLWLVMHNAPPQSWIELLEYRELVARAQQIWSARRTPLLVPDDETPGVVDAA
ncbi:MAG TPA: hypothetical protein VFS21_01650 [Roseiflexaceae bacterium]|nr:hypothetical protein [Roseiflexaceae bacterium]